MSAYDSRPKRRSESIFSLHDDIGNESISPSGMIGLGMPPFAESKPFLLRTTFMPHLSPVIQQVTNLFKKLGVLSTDTFRTEMHDSIADRVHALRARECKTIT